MPDDDKIHHPSPASTDPLDTVPAEERERIAKLAKQAANKAYCARTTGDMLDCENDARRARRDTIAREVAAYHARTKGGAS